MKPQETHSPDPDAHPSAEATTTDRRTVMAGLAGLGAGRLVGAALGGASGAPPAAAAPAAWPALEITNGPIRAQLALPDREKGYYRGTRFDWTGVITSLECEGHRYYGPWFDRTDPSVRDFIYDGQEIVAGACSAVTGPVDEFSTRGAGLGFEAAKPGGLFLKIGVGVLRKPDSGRYDPFTLSEIVDGGRWDVRPGKDRIGFTHEVADPGSGYAYRYEKRVRLSGDRPELVLEHTLHNTGALPIESETYNHNFLVLDRQPTGPDFEVRAPFALRAQRPPDPSLAEIAGTTVRYRKTRVERDTVYTGLEGFSDSPRDYDFHIENRKLGAAVRVRGDRPLVRLALWSIRSTLCLEPFLRLRVEPGGTFRWTYRYEYGRPAARS